MTEYRDIPSTTLGSAGLFIDLGVGGVGPEVYITLVESAGVAYTVQLADGNNTYEAPLSIQASSPYQVKKRKNLRFLTIKGNGARVTGKVTDYEVSPDSLTVTAPVSITGTVNTDIGQRSNTLTGTNPIQLSPIYSMPYVGGSTAPATGKWRFQAVLTTGGTALQVKIGSGTATDILPVGVETTPAGTQELTYELAVGAGTTYTITNGTVVAGSISVV